MRLTGGQIIAQTLARAGTPYIAGVPGHGIWATLDAFHEVADRIKVIQVMHEQSAVHLADGYYRASGVPLMAFASIGPGPANTIVGLGTAFVDSTAVLLVTGGPHSYMRGHSVLQELDRSQWADFPRVTSFEVDWSRAGACTMELLDQVMAGNAAAKNIRVPLHLNLTDSIGAPPEE